jgi:hypothetical protein
MAEIVKSNNLALTYVKQMDGEWAVGFNNRSTNSAQNFTIYFTNLANVASNTVAVVRNVWGLTNFGTYTNSFTMSVPAMDTQLLKIIPTGSKSVVGDLDASGKITAPYIYSMKREIPLSECAYYSIDYYANSVLSDSPLLHMPSFRLGTGGGAAYYFSTPVPVWASNVITTVFYQWEGAYPLRWTNDALSVSYDTLAWQFNGSDDSVGFTLTNHITQVRFTNWWNDAATPTMWDKRIMFRQMQAPTNTASRVFVLKILQEVMGNPAPQN